jgi:serine/threonine protein kinase
VLLTDLSSIADDDVLLLSSNSRFALQRDANSTDEPIDVDIDPELGLDLRTDSDFADQSACIVGAYSVARLLGKGGFGEVYLGVNRVSGQKVALKFVKKRDIMSVDVANRVSMEMRALMALDHQNIVKLYTVSALLFRCHVYLFSVIIHLIL